MSNTRFPTLAQAIARLVQAIVLPSAGQGLVTIRTLFFVTVLRANMIEASVAWNDSDIGEGALFQAASAAVPFTESSPIFRVASRLIGYKSDLLASILALGITPSSATSR